MPLLLFLIKWTVLERQTPAHNIRSWESAGDLLQIVYKIYSFCAHICAYISGAFNPTEFFISMTGPLELSVYLDFIFFQIGTWFYNLRAKEANSPLYLLYVITDLLSNLLSFSWSVNYQRCIWDPGTVYSGLLMSSMALRLNHECFFWMESSEFHGSGRREARVIHTEAGKGNEGDVP